MISKLFPQSLSVGTAAPDFTLPDQKGLNHRLSQYRGQWVVLYFYPKDQTFGCTKEACSFQDSSQDFKKLNAVVLGVSVDSVESHDSFAGAQKLDFPLLADTTKEVSRTYGVLLPIGIANRVTFLLNPEGKIVEKLNWVNWFRYGAQVADRLRALQAA